MKRNRIYTAIIPAVFAVDQAMKWTARRRAFGKQKPFKNKPGRSYRLLYSENKGAALNMGSSVPMLVAAASILLCCVMTLVYIFTLGRAGKFFLKTGLSFLLGGAYSNTYDRLRRKYVTDYISFNAGPAWFRNIVFNIADFAIMVGAVFITL